MHRMPSCVFVQMHTHSLVLRPYITAFGLAVRLAHAFLEFASTQDNGLCAMLLTLHR